MEAPAVQLVALAGFVGRALEALEDVEGRGESIPRGEFRRAVRTDGAAAQEQDGLVARIALGKLVDERSVWRLFPVATPLDEFFRKYSFRLDMEMGPRARSSVSGATMVTLLDKYSAQWAQC